MAEDARRHALRATFDQGAEEYDHARPVAAAAVLDDLVALAGLEAGARLLEVGCGTGQQTRPLAERGFSILAVELGANLAELARQKLAAFPDVKVVTSSFEDWEPGDERFEAVVSFNAFHWIDPDVRFAKPASVLQPGGALCVFGSLLLAHDDADPLWLAVHEDDGTVFGDAQPVRDVSDTRDRSEDFTRDGHFTSVTRKTYSRQLTYSADEYVGLLATMSAYRALPDDVREELLARISSRIRAAGGSIRPTRGDVLYVAGTTAA